VLFIQYLLHVHEDDDAAGAFVEGGAFPFGVAGVQ
jgi:hypothetical protein